MTNKHKDKIFELRAQGKSYSQIQNILGCSKGTIAYHLGEGQKEKSQQLQKKHREEIKEYIRNYKESAGCVDCEEKYPYFILDLDHLRDKEFNLSRFWKVTKDFEKVKKEIEKCEVVCANCHRIRTHSRSKNKDMI